MQRYEVHGPVPGGWAVVDNARSAGPISERTVEVFATRERAEQECALLLGMNAQDVDGRAPVVPDRPFGDRIADRLRERRRERETPSAE